MNVPTTQLLRVSHNSQDCFLAVEMEERIRANFWAPKVVRKPPEIFCCTFIMRMSCSAWLFVNGKLQSVIKRIVSSLKSFRRFSKLSPGRFAFLPFSFFKSKGGKSSWSFNPLEIIASYKISNLLCFLIEMFQDWIISNAKLKKNTNYLMKLMIFGKN